MSAIEFCRNDGEWVLSCFIRTWEGIMARKHGEETPTGKEPIDKVEGERKERNYPVVQRVLKAMVAHGTKSEQSGKEFITLDVVPIRRLGLFGDLTKVANTINPAKKNSFTFTKEKKGWREAPSSCSCALTEFVDFCAEYGVEIPSGWPPEAAEGAAEGQDMAAKPAGGRSAPGSRKSAPGKAR